MLTIRARYLEDKYKLDMSAAGNTSNLNGAIKRAVEKNELALPGGPSGRVKLVAVGSFSRPSFFIYTKTGLSCRPPSPRPLRRSPPLRSLLPLSPLRRKLPPRLLPRRLLLPPPRRLPLLSLLLPRKKPRLKLFYACVWVWVWVWGDGDGNSEMNGISVQRFQGKEWRSKELFSTEKSGNTW